MPCARRKIERSMLLIIQSSVLLHAVTRIGVQNALFGGPSLGPAWKKSLLQTEVSVRRTLQRCKNGDVFG